MSNNSRVLCEIERALRRELDTPHAKFDREMVEGRKSEIQDILGVLSPQSLLFGEGPSVIKSSTLIAPAVSGGTTVTSLAENGASQAPPSLVFHAILIVPLFLDFDTQACQRLIKRAFAPHELPSLIEAVFSSANADDMIRCLCVDDVQTFIDVVGEVRSTRIKESG